MLKIENLHFHYEQLPVLKGVDLSVEKGSILALIGVSGSGKTTLFRMISGLLSPSTGSISIDGIKGDNRVDQMTYMRQEDLLLPWRSVLKNMTLFSELGPAKKTENWEEKAYFLLKKMKMEKFAHSYPSELSGGMRQRVALARALLQERSLLLLDEPFASLDVLTREELYLLLQKVRKEEQKTIVMVTHDFRDALALADHIYILSNGKITKKFDINSDLRNSALERMNLMEQIRFELSASLEEA